MFSDRTNIKSYLKLIHQFPLRPIRSDAELDEAITMIDSLLDRDALLPAEEDYLDVLSDLVERYETENYPIPPVSDADLLEYLIVDAKGVTQAEVARQTGIAESTISEVLAGKRFLNRTHIQKLALYFHIDPGVFLQEECGSNQGCTLPASEGKNRLAASGPGQAAKTKIRNTPIKKACIAKTPKTPPIQEKRASVNRSQSRERRPFKK